MPRIARLAPGPVLPIVLVALILALAFAAAYFQTRRYLRCSYVHRRRLIACGVGASRTPDIVLPAE
jgi:hypothetical protein